MTEHRFDRWSFMLTQSEIHQIADIIWERILERQKEVEEPEFMSFAEIRQMHSITDDTLTRWVKKAGIKTYRYGKGKAIKRKDYRKLVW